MSRFDQEIMARTAMGEARGEGQEGMQAVMWTGMNRYTAKRWYSSVTIAGTFLKFMQYDCWMPKDPNFIYIVNITEKLPLFTAALVWAGYVLNGTLVDPTQGATHYYDDSIAAPDWVEGAIFTVKIGRLNFYKNVN